MRQINIILSSLLALSLGFAGCSSEEPIASEGTTSNASSTGTPVSFSAVFSSEYDGSIKKLAYGTVGAQTSINWTANDHIRIWSSMASESPAQGIYMTAAGGDPAEFAHVNQIGSTEITWASDISSSQPQQFQAFFPGNAATTGFTTDGKAQFTVASTQHLTAANGYGMDNVLLYAAATAESKSDNIAFEFENVVTVLKLVLPSSIQDDEGNPVTIDRVTIQARGTHADKLAGTFTASTAGSSPVGGFASFSVDNASKSNVITVSTNNWTTPLYVALAPYGYDELTVTIVGTNGSGISTIVSTAGIAGRKLYPIEKNPLVWKGKRVDLGIHVLTETLPNGGKRTRWISNAARTIAWELDDRGGHAYWPWGRLTGTNLRPSTTLLYELGASLSDIKTLYFATGNLHVSKTATDAQLRAGNRGVIAPVDKDNISLGTGNNLSNLTGYASDALNGSYYAWGDPFGNMPSDNRNDYPLSTGEYAYPGGIRPQHISGSKWDIATHQLGSDWRLPTIVEWAFLIEEVSTTGKSNPTSYGYSRFWGDTDGGFYSSGQQGSFSGPWQSTSGKQGYLLTSTNGSSIFLPALGILHSLGGNLVKSHGGTYWSGSSSGEIASASDLFFTPQVWMLATRDFASRHVVRPVSEY